MKAFLRDLWALFKAHKALLWWTFAGGLLLLLVGSATGVYLSSQSRFCDSCHYMKPYVAAWKTSSHRTVECEECHFPDDPLGYAYAKAQGIATAIRYMVGTFDISPVAAVDDATCLKAGCHESRLLTGPIVFMDSILFDHEAHLGADRRGITLRCTSCHSQIVQGEHMKVTDEVCFTCHFQGTERIPELHDCRLCHGAPSRTVGAGFAFRHDSYLREGVQCEECHTRVTEGSGRVPPDRCRTCHMEPEHTELLQDHVALHRRHVTQEKVECFQCHSAVRHGKLEIRPNEAGACASCHQFGHVTVAEVLLGQGARGVPDTPDPMYEMRIHCTSCHRMEAPAANDGDTHVTKAPPNVCSVCHTEGYNTMLVRWKDFLRASRERLAPALLYLRDVAPPGSPPRSDAHELPPPLGGRVGVGGGAPSPPAGEARAERDALLHNARFLEHSRGVHNIFYARRIVADLDRRLADWRARDGALPDSGVPFEVRALDNSCTRRCHEPPRDRVMWRGFDFPHQPHLAENFDCSRCHDHSTRHGGMSPFTKDECNGCHHRDEDADCGGCHRYQQLLLRGGAGGGPVPKMMKMTDTCDACHDVEEVAANAHGDQALVDMCSSCHSDEDFNRQSLAGWRVEERRVLGPLQARLERLRARRPDAPEPAAFARELAQVAQDLEVLTIGRWAHNPLYARAAADRLSARLAALEARLVER